MVYNKIIESDGRKASVFVRSDGSIVLTEKHDLNEPYSPSMRGKPNDVVLYGSPAGNYGRQANIMIFDKQGDTLLMLHYGSHGNLKNHPYGERVDGIQTGYHAHDVSPTENKNSVREMTETESKYLRR